MVRTTRKKKKMGTDAEKAVASKISKAALRIMGMEDTEPDELLACEIGEYQFISTILKDLYYNL